MKVTIHPAADRGVSQLMLVGDADVPLSPLESHPAQTLAVMFGLGVVAAKTRGLTRLAVLAGALAAGALATRR